MTKYEFFTTFNYDRNDNVKKNFHNLLLYYNPKQYHTKREIALQKYEEILNLYTLYTERPQAFDKNLVMNRVNVIINNFYSKSKSVINDSIYYISLENLYKNNVIVNENCGRCKGLGFRTVQICTKCLGLKSLDFLVYNECNMSIKKGECDECEGHGYIGFGDKCQDCHGLKYLPKKVSVNRFSGDNFKVKLGDNYYTFYLKPDAHFSKRADDLVYLMNIHLSDLVNGFQYKINLLNRKNIIIKSKELLITDPNREYLIPNLGFISDKGVGNLIIKLNVIYPKSIQEFHLHKNEKYILDNLDKFLDIFEI